MAENDSTIELRREIHAPTALVWGVVADTNRWDRILGAPPSEYVYPEDRPSNHARRAIGKAAMVWGDDEWEEVGDWVEGVWFVGERHFRRGPFTLIQYHIDTDPLETGTLVRMRVLVRRREGVAEDIATFFLTRAEAKLSRALEAAARLLSGAQIAPEGDEPAVSLAARALLERPVEPSVQGRSATLCSAELEHRAMRLEQLGCDAKLAARLVEHVRSRPDDEVVNMRPFALARAWGFSGRELLRVFLLATKAGIVDLSWELICESCQGSAGGHAALSEVQSETHCRECDRDFCADVARNIEAVFHVNRAIRAVTNAVYCGGSPTWRPHVAAALEIPPSQSSELRLPPTEAERVAHVSYAGESVMLPRFGKGDRFELRLEEGGLRVTRTGSSGDGTEFATFTLINTTSRPQLLSIERTGWELPRVRGIDVLTLQDFVDLFGAEAPATGCDLQISRLALLFTDLKGSTRLYEELGDARAFAVIQQHFAALGAIAEREGGAVVKTIGDAILAVFPAAPQALRAAIEMVRVTRTQHGIHDLALKVGVHEGSCIAVRANDRLDYFGRSVNLAARLQGAAKEDTIVLLSSALEHPEIVQSIKERGLELKRFNAEMKGIGSAQECVALTMPLGALAAGG